jgi:hypothetical protein
MTNRHLSQAPKELIAKRLNVFLSSLNGMSDRMILESDIISRYQTGIQLFYDSLEGSALKNIPDFVEGRPADPLDMRYLFSALSKDIKVMFFSLSALDKMITSSFNSIISTKESALEKIKRTSNKIGDYLLYSDPSLGAGFFFGDSFNSPEKIEVGSSLIEGEECYLGLEEGIVLLPLDGEPEKPKIKTIVVNKASNGQFGNSTDSGITGKDDISSVTDGRPNTWVEYEKVTSRTSNTPLVLDITICLSAISVINHIHINPINFGSRKPVFIETIETSKDGKIFTSIKDEIPFLDFLPEDEENKFTLSAATSKYSGQGFYSFLPRKAQYIHIVFKQKSPYPVNTQYGERLRYAIGLRDINIYGRRFKPQGSIVSVPFSSEKELKKVSLYASENPTQKSVLSDINHSVSIDDGGSWIFLQPLERQSVDAPEILNFNLEVDGATKTADPVISLRHKISMIRNSKEFEGEVVVKEEKKDKSELVPIPPGNDPYVTTSEEFIEETLKVIIPFNGSFSCPRGRSGLSVANESFLMKLDRIDFNVDVPPIDSLKFELPFIGIPNLSHRIRVFVNGSQIEYCPKDNSFFNNPSTTSYANGIIDENSKIYFLNKKGTELQFGHTIRNGDRKGFLPPAGSRISVVLDGDNPRLELTPEGYLLKLSAQSDGLKRNTHITYFDELQISSDNDFVWDSSKEIEITIPKGRAEAEIINFDDVKFLPPVFPDTRKPVEEDIESFNATLSELMRIEEWNPTTKKKITSTTSTWLPVGFIDGDKEFQDYDGENPRFSFDSYTGTLYLSQKSSSTNKTTFSCKSLEAKEIDRSKWSYYTDPISGAKDFSKILISMSEVKTFKRTLTVTDDAQTSINLLLDNAKSHNWFNQKVVKGTVYLDKELFNNEASPIEVPYEDGVSEFSRTVSVLNETVNLSIENQDYNIYKYTLLNIGENKPLKDGPNFSPKRSSIDPKTPTGIFLKKKEYKESNPYYGLSTDGDWCFDGENTVYIIYSESTIPPHSVSYSYTEEDSGINKSGLYSVDYDQGIVYFGRPTNAVNKNINYEVSIYSAFYNIAERVNKDDIIKLDPKNKRIDFSEDFGMKIIKMSAVDKSRIQYLKLVYKYNDQQRESIKDLEPYFSPICKDVAFRAVTADLLEEI